MTIPARSRDRMAEDVIKRVEPKECMHEAAVADVSLGRLDQPLADVGVKGLQPSHEQEVDQ